MAENRYRKAEEGERKMKYAVSACLCGINCKYNGGNNYNQELVEFLKDKEYITVCPECAGGMPVPRTSSEIRGDRVVNKNGEDVTAYFQKGAETELERIKTAGAGTVILQPRSPSCGKDSIYDGTFTGTRIPGNGIFVRKLLEAGICCLTVDEFLATYRQGTDSKPWP